MEMPIDENELDFSPISAEEMTFMARKMFKMYDEEEASQDALANEHADSTTDTSFADEDE